MGEGLGVVLFLQVDRWWRGQCRCGVVDWQQQVDSGNGRMITCVLINAIDNCG